MTKNYSHVCLQISGFLAIMLVASCDLTERPSEAPKPVSQVIGELILEFDSSYLELGDPNPFGSGPISSAYKKNYQQYVANMSEEDRLAYFWAGLWHFQFQEGTMDLYTDVVGSDVAYEKFAQELRKFVERSKSSGREGWRTNYAEQALHHLKKHQVDNQP